MFHRTLIGPLLCLLTLANSSCHSEEKGTDSLGEVVFYDDVAKIMEQKCVPCHQVDGGAPFVLTSYEAVSRKAKTIVEVTQKGIMPPWPADPNYQHFIGERLLTEREKQLIKAWVDQGKLKGPGERVLQAKTPKGLKKSKPDLILDMPMVSLRAGDQDRFFLMRIPGLLEQDTWVKAMEIRPGVRERLHHFNGVELQAGQISLMVKRNSRNYPRRIRRRFCPIGFVGNRWVPTRAHSLGGQLPTWNGGYFVPRRHWRVSPVSAICPDWQ
jgi:hypothetical protein